MEKLKNSQEFLKLCRDLRQKGIIRTKEEYLKMMMNIAKKYFKKMHINIINQLVSLLTLI